MNDLVTISRLAILVFTCGLANCLGAGEHPTVELSTLKVFEFDRIEGAPPPAIDYAYRAEMTGKDEISVYDAGTSDLFHMITIPNLWDLDPQVENKGFKGYNGFSALPGGDLLLYYYTKTAVVYKHARQEFAILPKTLKVAKENYQIESWDWHAEGVFLGQVQASQVLDFIYILFQTSDGKAYKIENLPEFTSSNVAITNPDSLQSAVQISTVAPLEEEGGDTEITAVLGLYKIVEKK